MKKNAKLNPLDTDFKSYSTYDPDALLDYLIKIHDLKNDAELSRKLKLSPPIVSKIRHKRLQISSNIIIRIHDVTEIPINEIRSLMGIPVYKHASKSSGRPIQKNSRSK